MTAAAVGGFAGDEDCWWRETVFGMEEGFVVVDDERLGL